jgi:hypothetical protein
VAREDSQFLVHLIAVAALGDAIYGAPFRRSAGLPEGSETDRRFLAWLAALVHARAASSWPVPPDCGRWRGSGIDVFIFARPPHSGGFRGWRKPDG